ncbi:MAG: FKBP-type peptidyl-prolyl cis-trans isomerase [Planctomycetota bacterium]|nr:FKBP-type peptidyl-prolyl cis-trans isomerase [Planctomycetota bacterium]
MKPFAFFSSIVLTLMSLSGCVNPDINIEETPINVVSDSPGRGRMAVDGRIVYIDYKVLMPNGDEVLSHKDWRFVLGKGSVVEGMDDAVKGMRPGGVRVVKCPPHKHWGRNGYGKKIPPNTTLTFDIKLNRVE